MNQSTLKVKIKAIWGLAAVLLLAAALGAVWTSPDRGQNAEAQTPTTLGIDANSSGNTATSLGSIDSCRVVSPGASFTADVFVTDVVDLLAWTAMLAYNEDVVTVTGVNVFQFQDAQPGSDLFDVSSDVPPEDLYLLGAVDQSIELPGTGDSGTGVLARLSLQAGASAGWTSLDIGQIDIGDPPGPDYPWLKDSTAAFIDGGTNGVFTGPISEAIIVVGASDDCLDFDGFTAATETYLGTDPNDGCAEPSGSNNEPTPDKWPLDFNDDQKSDIFDLTSYIAPDRHFNTNVGAFPDGERWDLSPGKGPLSTDINIIDLSLMVTNVPVMFGGERGWNHNCITDYAGP